MKKIKIESFADPNFLKFGFVALALGILVFILSFVFHFDPIIALRAGGGLGIMIIVIHYIAKFSKK